MVILVVFCKIMRIYYYTFSVNFYQFSKNIFILNFYILMNITLNKIIAKLNKKGSKILSKFLRNNSDEAFFRRLIWILKSNLYSISFSNAIYKVSRSSKI